MLKNILKVKMSFIVLTKTDFFFVGNQNAFQMSLGTIFVDIKI